MKKKFGLVALVLCIVSCAAIFAVACKKPVPFEDPKHEHEYEETYTFDEEYHWYKCKGCNEIDAHERHTFEWVVDGEADYENDGIKHEECSICHYQKEPQSIQKLEKQVPTLNLTTISKEYDGNAASLELGVDYTASQGAGEISIAWYQKGEITALSSAPSAVGEYEIEFCFAEGATFKAHSVKKDFEITAKALNLAQSTKDKFTKTYDGSNKIEIDLSSEDGVVSGDSLQLVLTFNSANAGASLQSAQFSSSSVGASNYSLNTTGFVGSIETRALSGSFMVTLNDSLSATSDGYGYAVVATEGLLGEDSCTITIYLVENEAGTYASASANVSKIAFSNSNYSAGEISLVVVGSLSLSEPEDTVCQNGTKEYFIISVDEEQSYSIVLGGDSCIVKLVSKSTGEEIVATSSGGTTYEYSLVLGDYIVELSHVGGDSCGNQITWDVVY